MPETRFVTRPHLRIEYTEAGDPAGSPVVLLHGFPDSRSAWAPLMERWQGPPVRFLAPSMRGYGRTEILDPEAHSGEFAALADDVRQLLDGLTIDRAIVIGHDWGARAAWGAAALWPERARAVIGLASEYVAFRNTGQVPFAQQHAYWYQWFFHTPQGVAALERDRAELGAYLWKAWSPTWEFSREDALEASQAWQNPQFVATVVSYYRVRYGNAPTAPRYHGLAEKLQPKPVVSVPAWFLTGLADACNLPEGSIGQEAWFSAGYERRELPGIGHFIPREAPQAVEAALLQALSATN